MPSKRSPSLPVEARASAIHGTGVYARKKLHPEDVIGFYEGRRYTAKEMARRSWDHSLTHVFGLSDGSIINGAEGGNATSFINHSCAPNCVAYEVERDGQLTIRIEALHEIATGEELFLDYGLDVGDNDVADYRCECGAPTCRGTLAALRQG